MTTHIFQTEDHGLAAKLHAVVLQHHGHPGATPLMGSTALTPPPAAPAGTPAPPPPPATTAAPPPPPPPAPAAAAPPPPPPPATAAAPATPAAAENPALMIPAAGWTEEHLKGAAGSYTAKHGAANLVEALRPFCPTGTAKPSVKKVYPAYWANAYGALTAA